MKFVLKLLRLNQMVFERKLKGQTLVEYSLIIMLVGSVIFVLLNALGVPLSSFFEKVTNSMSSASG